jgi:hypothetical protein
MKKKMMGIIAAVAVAVVAGYNIYASQSNVKLSDLALANVEALANNNEWDTPFYVHPCPTGPGTECSSAKYDEHNKCATLTYC